MRSYSNLSMQLLAYPNRSMLHQTHHLAPISSGPMPPFTFISPTVFIKKPATRAYVRLLGPCFKTGRLKPFRQDYTCSPQAEPPPVLHRIVHHALHAVRNTTTQPQPAACRTTRASLHFQSACRQRPKPRSAITSQFNSGPPADQPITKHLPSAPILTSQGRTTSAPQHSTCMPASPPRDHLPQQKHQHTSTTPQLIVAPSTPTDSNRFLFNGFTYCLTLFSKFFSSFPHGTCSLSVSCPYLALDEIYHPFWAAFPNNPTLRRHLNQHPPCPQNGTLTLSGVLFQGTSREQGRHTTVSLQTTIP